MPQVLWWYTIVQSPGSRWIFFYIFFLNKFHDLVKNHWIKWVDWAANLLFAVCIWFKHRQGGGECEFYFQKYASSVCISFLFLPIEHWTQTGAFLLFSMNSFTIHVILICCYCCLLDQMRCNAWWWSLWIVRRRQGEFSTPGRICPTSDWTLAKC